jgi:DNA-binding transcriptional MocR family regulator
MRDLVAHDRRPVCFLVYLWLTKEQQQLGETVQVSYRELAESIGVSKSSVQSAVSWLARRKLLSVSKKNATATPRYAVLRPWAARGAAEMRGTDSIPPAPGHTSGSNSPTAKRRAP